MKLRLTAILAMLPLSLSAADNGYKASNGIVYPWCGENAIDPDNDGWGWENEASCKVAPVAEDTEPVKEEGTEEDEVSKPKPVLGIDEMPKNSNGIPVYGEGYGRGTIRVRGKGVGIVRCNPIWGLSPQGDGFDSRAYVRIPSGKVGGWNYGTRKYVSEAATVTCARNKTIMKCAFEHSLSFCEDNVKVSNF